MYRKTKTASTLGYIDGDEVVSFDAELFDHGCIPLIRVLILDDVNVIYRHGGHAFDVVMITYIADAD